MNFRWLEMLLQGVFVIEGNDAAELPISGHTQVQFACHLERTEQVSNFCHLLIIPNLWRENHPMACHVPPKRSAGT